jgi:hypothetical protein
MCAESVGEFLQQSADSMATTFWQVICVRQVCRAFIWNVQGAVGAV